MGNSGEVVEGILESPSISLKSGIEARIGVLSRQLHSE
jgi:hypothetical protein